MNRTRVYFDINFAADSVFCISDSQLAVSHYLQWNGTGKLFLIVGILFYSVVMSGLSSTCLTVTLMA